MLSFGTVYYAVQVGFNFWALKCGMDHANERRWAFIMLYKLVLAVESVDEPKNVSSHLKDTKHYFPWVTPVFRVFAKWLGEVFFLCFSKWGKWALFRSECARALSLEREHQTNCKLCVVFLQLFHRHGDGWMYNNHMKQTVKPNDVQDSNASTETTER